jgi:hypothetical protein
MALKTVKAYSLSNDDINAILDPDTRVFSYPEFNSMTSIDEAFDPLGRCVFLFLTESERVGHWVCMFKRDSRTIEYFDSYGQKPDAQRSWLTAEKLAELNQSTPRLTELLKQSGYRVYYNTYQYQTDKADINTCGRWCVARLICKDLSNLQFYNCVKKSGLSPDDWVGCFTADILGK